MFTQYQLEDQVISSDAVISPLWSGDISTLTAFATSSDQNSFTSAPFTRFYLNVFKNTPSPVQFSIAYGHREGSGSSYFNVMIPNLTPTRDIYGQFRSLIYGDENTSFTFGGVNNSSNEIIVLSVNRARFKESLNPGSFYLNLHNGGSQIGLVDDSTIASTSTYIGSSRVYQLLSGSMDINTNRITPLSSAYTSRGSYGMIIPDQGLVILNPKALALPTNQGGLGVTFDTRTPAQMATAEAAGDRFNVNNRLIYRLITGASLTSGTADPKFNLQNYETISSRYFFTRVKNADYNYTTNPTVIDNNGNLIHLSLIYNPQTFITTVGMYNNVGDLVAVAKLNKPLVKDFTKELLLRVKLDF